MHSIIASLQNIQRYGIQVDTSHTIHIISIIASIHMDIMLDMHQTTPELKEPRAVTCITNQADTVTKPCRSGNHFNFCSAPSQFSSHGREVRAQIRY